MNSKGMAGAAALTCVLMSCSPVISQELPSSDELVSSLLRNTRVVDTPQSGYHPMTRWEKDHLTLWIVGAQEKDLAKAEQIESEVSRIFAIARINIDTCLVITTTPSQRDDCQAQQNADLVYIVSDEPDLLQNVLYLTVLKSLNSQPDFLIRFSDSAQRSFERGLKCHVSVRVTDNQNRVGYRYIAALLLNGEGAGSEFDTCNETLAYEAAGVGPIRGVLGSKDDPPVFSDAAISLLYSASLPPGSSPARIKAEALQLGASP